MKLHTQKKQEQRTGAVAKVEEFLPIKHWALSSTPSTTKKEQKFNEMI
jgi:hypothetical protein